MKTVTDLPNEDTHECIPLLHEWEDTTRFLLLRLSMSVEFLEVFLEPLLSTLLDEESLEEERVLRSVVWASTSVAVV